MCRHEGAPGIELGKLLAQTGYVTAARVSSTPRRASAITFIDGEKGILRYRGYPIEQLAEQVDFIEVSYLLIYGELPTKEQLDEFANDHAGTRCCTRT